MTKYLRSIYLETLEQLDAARLTQQALQDFSNLGKSDIVALGKAAATMSAGARRALRADVSRGFVLTKTSHLGEATELSEFELHEAAHPVPDQNGIAASRCLKAWLQQPSSEDRSLVVLLSGGTSSLLIDPNPPLSLSDLKKMNRALLASGMSIETMNILRKHLSRVKGGKLAELCSNYSRIVQLVLVDIAAPDLSHEEVVSLVGSGPFSADPSTLEQAREVLSRLEPQLTAELFLKAEQALRETPKESPCESRILADHTSLRIAAVELLGDRHRTHPQWPAAVEGEVREVAQSMARFAEARLADSDGVFVSTGEPTVTLCQKPGRGGRCQELALRFSKEIAGRSDIALLAGSSDGTDGPTDDAGALVTGQTWPELVQRVGECSLLEMLENNDCGSALALLPGALLTTGPTGQNLNDLYLLQVGKLSS